MQYVSTYSSSASFWKAVFHQITAKRLFFFFSATIVALSFLYIYFINATIRNVVAYGSLQQENATMSLAVNSLQSQYITQKSALSLTVAYADGYQDANTPQFIAGMPASGDGAILSYK